MKMDTESVCGFRKIGKIGVRRCLTVLLAGCAAFGWWGALYPQFTLLSGTYKVVREADSGLDASVPAEELSTEAAKDGTLYWQILCADRSQIRVKSKIWENWKTSKGVGSERYESGD